MLNLQEIVFEIEGTADLLMHNRRLADPVFKTTRAMKEISAKKKKTDADFLEMKRLEFSGGLYIDENGPYIPSEWTDSMIRDGAKVYKQGKLMTAGVMPSSPFSYLIYKGPKTEDELFDNPAFVDTRGVRVQTSVVMRTRPLFPIGWRLKFGVKINTDVIQPKDVERAIDAAGSTVGLGDYRPKFGRFVLISATPVEQEKTKKGRGEKNGK